MVILTIAVKASKVFIIKVIGKYTLTNHTLIAALGYRIFVCVCKMVYEVLHRHTLAQCMDRILNLPSEDFT